MDKNILRIQFQNSIAELNQEIQRIQETIASIENIKASPKSTAGLYQTVALITNYLTLAELYLKINDSHLNILKRNSDSYLELARKQFSFITSKGGDSFGVRIHSSLSENQKTLDTLTELTPLRVFHLCGRMNKDFLALKSLYTQCSPIHVTLASTYKKMAGLSLNMTNFRSWLPYSVDLSSKHYESCIKLVALVLEMIDLAADMAMENYYLNKNKESLTEALGLLEHLEAIQRLLKSRTLQETIRKKESWQRCL